jgi:phospholipid/cholesterol/gamma-HCH transport system substrate-binding protein
MSKELKVGAFVLVCVLVFVATLVYVDELSGVHVPFKTYFKYAGGVDVGSAVRFGGMKVGSITAMRQWSKDPTKIEVVLEVEGGVPVNADSVAMLTSLGPLGDRYLEIATGSNHARRMPPGSTIPSIEPVSLDDLARQVSELIPTVQSTLQDVRKDIDQVASNAGIALANIQTMTGPQNQRNLSLLLANARDLLDRESSQIDTVLKNLERASSQASSVISQVSGVATQANDAFTEIQKSARTADDTFATANRTIGEIRDPIKSDLADLQQTMAEARRLISNLNTSVSANRNNIDDTLENFRIASENLRELTLSVRQRPWTLIRGTPARDRAVPVVAGKP